MGESVVTKEDHLDDLTESMLTNQHLQSRQDESRRNFFPRAFGPLTPGAMRGAIFAMLSASLGTGTFNLPYRIGSVGILSYFLFLLVTGLFSYLGMYLISQLILKAKASSYSCMSEQSYGHYFRKVAEFCLVLYPWGITICYQVLITKFIVQLLADNFNLPLYDGDVGRQSEIYSQTGDWVRIGVSIGVIALNMVFVLKKTIGVLQKIAVIGVLAVIYNVIVVSFTLFTGFRIEIENQDKTSSVYDYHGFTSISWGTLDWFGGGGDHIFLRQIQSIAALFFCYISHQMVFPLIKDLKNPTERRVNKVIRRVHIVEIISNFLVGMAGYLLLAEHIGDLPINAMVMSSIQTIPMSIGKLLMALSLFFSLPLNLFAAREVMYDTFGIQKTNKNHILLSVGLALSGTTIGILFQKVNSYFGLLGGTAGVMVAGLVPIICYYKLLGLNSWRQKLMGVFMLVASLLGMVGAILSVVFPT